MYAIRSYYEDQYDPALLCPFPRRVKREELGIREGELPFGGYDIWNAYELSWLTPSGKPVVGMAEFRFPCSTPNLIESKSFKLYLNSFNQTRVITSYSIHYTKLYDATSPT